MRPDPADWQTPDEPGGSVATDRSTRKRPARTRRRGAEPDDPEGRDLGPDSDPYELARKILLQRLSDQPRSRAELAESLAKRDVPADVAAQVLDRFEEVGLVDDAAFARAWADSRQRTRGLAGRALAQELRKKGVDDEVVRDTVAEIDTDDEREVARRLVRKRLPALRRYDRQVQVRRLAGMLARKGYASALAYSVIKEELDVELDPDL